MIAQPHLTLFIVEIGLFYKFLIKINKLKMSAIKSFQLIISVSCIFLLDRSKLSILRLIYSEKSEN